jgi:hypothetical protein
MLLLLVLGTADTAGAAGGGAAPPSPGRFGSLAAVRQEQGAVFRVEDLAVEPGEARAGEPVTVSVTVVNTGDREGKYALDLLVDGEAGPRVTGELPARGKRTHFKQVVRVEQGTHTVSAGDLLTSFAITPASFSVLDFEVSPSLVRPGDPVRVVGRIVNTGGVAGTYSVPVFVSGVAERGLEGFLPAGESAPFLLTLEAPESGIHTVSAGRATGSFGVFPPAVDTPLVKRVEVLPVTTVAMDDKGTRLVLEGQEVQLERVDTGLLAVRFPVALGQGRTLVSFEDPTAGVYYRNNRLELRFPGPRGAPEVKLLAEMDPPVDGGGTARGVAGDLRLRVEGVEVDVSLADETLRRVGVSLDMALQDVALGSALTLLPRKEVLPLRRQQLEAAAREQRLTVTAVALELEQEPGGPGGPAEVEYTDVEVALSAQWVSAVGGAQSVRMAWEDGEGALRLLVLQQAGQDGAGRELLAGRIPGGFVSLTVLAVAPLGETAVSMVLDPAAVAPGGTALVSVSVENRGSAAATAPLTMAVDGQPQRTKLANLETGERRVVKFFVSLDEPGEHVVAVEGPGG